MKNNYLYVGENGEFSVIFDKLLSQIEDYEIIKYDASQNLLSEVIKDASMHSMFNSNKVIVVYEFKHYSEKELDSLYLYLNSYNPSSYLIFVCDSEIDKRKKLYKWFSSNKCILGDEKFDINKYVMTVLKTNGYSISEVTCQYFISIVGEDINSVNNELSKLMLLKSDNRIIECGDIDSISISSFDDNIFNFTKAVLDGDVKGSLRLYHDFTNHGTDEVALINILASQFRSLYQVKHLSNCGKTNKEISIILGFTNPYRVNMCQKNASKYSEDDLLRYLYALGKMDINIKSGFGDKKCIFELFLINKNIAIL